MLLTILIGCTNYWCNSNIINTTTVHTTGLQTALYIEVRLKRVSLLHSRNITGSWLHNWYFFFNIQSWNNIKKICRRIHETINDECLNNYESTSDTISLSGVVNNSIHICFNFRTGVITVNSVYDMSVLISARKHTFFTL